MTGTRASCCTRAIRFLPPRGTMTSTLPSRPDSIIPTASLLRVGTIWTASRESDARSSACSKHAWIAVLELKLSEPPRRITALPDFRHSAPASAVTFGRLS